MRTTHLALMFFVVFFLFVPAALPAQDCYTTLDDGVWGNPRRDFNDVPIPVLIDSLIPVGDPIVIGIPGRSVAFADGGEPCILDGLPGGGRPRSLTGEFVDAVVDTDCVLPEGFPANRKGKFRNALLGETMALALNCRLDPDLPWVVVTPVMLTVPALPGDDGLYGTADDSLCADCDTMTVRMPAELMAVLADSLGVEPTVEAVLGMANASLGGGDTYGLNGKTMWRAVSNLNRAFKRSRFLVSSEPDTIIITLTMQKPDTAPEGRAAISDGAALALVPLRSAGGISAVRLSLPEQAYVTAVAYNVAGRKVAVLADRILPSGETVLEFPSDRHVPSGVYFVRADAALPSGASRLTAKVVVLR